MRLLNVGLVGLAFVLLSIFMRHLETTPPWLRMVWALAGLFGACLLLYVAIRVSLR